MSVWQLNPAKASTPSADRPRLTGIDGRLGRRIGGLGFAALVVLLLAGGMIGLLALNTSIQNTQMALNKAQKQAATLALEVSDRQAQVYAKSGPGQLAAAAGALGMVPNPNPVYVDLRTGKVVGQVKPVTGTEIPALKAPPASTASAGTVTPVQTTVQGWFDLTPAPAPAAPAAPAAAAPAAPAAPTAAAPAKSPTTAATTAAKTPASTAAKATTPAKKP